MATVTVTKSPEEIAGLSNSKVYALQNTGSIDLKIHEGASEPTDLNDAFIVRPGSIIKMRKVSSKKFFIWFESYDRLENTKAVYFEG